MNTIQRRQQLRVGLFQIPHLLFILSTLLLILLQIEQVSSQIAIQGYIYWDVNSNGILDFDSSSSSGGGNSGGEGGGELENGIIDVQVEVKTCNSLLSSSSSNNNNEEEENVIIAKGKTTWPSTYPNEQIIPGHSAIYPNGGYYKLNLEGRDDMNVNCLLTKTQYQTSDFYSSSGGGGVGGCYLSVVAPIDYEITSSFPIHHVKTNNNNEDGWGHLFNISEEEEKGSGEEGEEGTTNNNEQGDPFDWIPYNDNQYNIPTPPSNNNNRGYSARTKQCFGYHTASRTWYVWTPSIVSSTASSSSLDASTNNNKNNNEQEEEQSPPIQIQLPNTFQYGYNTYLEPQLNYDQTLSIKPCGMYYNTDIGWPLPVRLKSKVILGLEFNTNNKMQSDRFQLSTVTNVKNVVSLEQYLLDEKIAQLSLQINDDENSNNEMLEAEVTTTNNTNTNYRHTNNYGMLSFPTIFEEVMLSLLNDKLSFFLFGGEQQQQQSEGGEGDELVYLKVVINNMWSLMKIVDTKSTTGAGGGGGSAGKKKKRVVVDEHYLKGHDVIGSHGRLLRGYRGGSMADEAASTITSIANAHMNNNDNSNHLLLRGGQRSLLAITQPHLIFSLQIYTKYTETQPPSIPTSYKDIQSMETKALSKTTNFGTIASRTINTWRDELVLQLRMRSGYGQECNIVDTTIDKDTNDDDEEGSGEEEEEIEGLEGYNTISVTDNQEEDNTDNNALPQFIAIFNGESPTNKQQQDEDGEYTEVNIGVVNRFDCNKLLPLYYYELNNLAVREISNNNKVGDNTNSVGEEEQLLTKAIELLSIDDNIYGPPSSLSTQDSSTDNNTSSSMPTWLIITISALTLLSLLAFIGGLYVRNERKKLKLEKERRRLIKEERLKNREERRKRKEERRNKKKKQGGKRRSGDVEGEEGDSVNDDEIVHDLIGNDELHNDDDDQGVVNKDKDDVVDSVGDDDVGSGKEVGKDATRTRRRTTEVGHKSSIVSDSDDSELDRLFASGNKGVVAATGTTTAANDDGEVASPPAEQDALATLLTVTSLQPTKRSDGGGTTGGGAAKPKRRRKKRGGAGSESDSNYTASNPDALDFSASGLNNDVSNTDRSKEVSTTLEGTVGDTTTSDTGKNNKSGGGGGEDKDADNKKGGKIKNPEKPPPPSRITLSKRDKMEKGISELSLRLTASIRRSGNQTSLQVREDIKEGGPGQSPQRKKKKVVRKKKKPSTTSGSGANKKEEDTDPRHKKPRRATLNKMMSSFRGVGAQGSDEKIDEDAALDAAEAGNNNKKKMIEKKRPVAAKPTSRSAPPKRGMTGFKAMSSMRMSIKNIVIGDLSSDSDDDSDSSSSSSGSDDDDDDSSSSDSSMEEKKPAKKSQQKHNAASGTRRKAVDDNGHGGKEPIRRDGSDRHLGKQNEDLHKSELTHTNDYLPHRNLDGPEQNPKQVPLKDHSHRSLGSKQSSKSSLDLEASNHSLKNKKSSSKGSDFNISHQSLSKKSSKGSDHNISHQSLKKGTRSSKSSSDKKKSSSKGKGTHHRDNPGDGKKTSKSRRPTGSTDDKVSSSHNNHGRENHHGKKKERSTKTRPRLSELKSSLTSSVKLLQLKKGNKSLSDIAALTLEEDEDHGTGALDRSRSERGSKRDMSERSVSNRLDVSARGSERGSRKGSTHDGGAKSSSHHRRKDSAGGEGRKKKDGTGGDERKKKTSSATANKAKSSSHHGKKHSHSKHKSSKGATDGADKKSKSKSKRASTEQ